MLTNDMTEPAFDQDAPLPGPPDPWASTSQPTWRDGPPYHMTDMIAAEPAIAERLIARLADPAGAAAELAREVAGAVRAGNPVVVTGCGTSDHAAQAVAVILRSELHSGGHLVRSHQAFELSLDPPSSGLVIGVSHEGATTATNAALDAARAAGSRTALITVTRRSPGAALVDLVVETEELDQSWCHTVGYLSPIVAATAMAAHLAGGEPLSGASARALLTQDGSDDEGIDRIAGRLASSREVLVIATGADRPAGRELVLKIEEGSWVPAAYRDLETFLHGHLAATGEETGLVLILTDRDRRPERLARARAALRAARTVGIDTAAILAAEADAAVPADLTSAGRLLVDEAPDLPSPVAALLGGTVPLQLLAERIARARGVNPDAIHREVDRYREAADAAESAEATSAP
jgi:fructoselysine-6-P-deglycase FrlB-like protein